MMNRIELNEEELNKVAGGEDLQGTANTWYHGTYTCPFCGKKHEFVTKPAGFCGSEVDQYRACTKTTGADLLTFGISAVNGIIRLWDQNSKAHQVEYQFDYVVAGGVRHDMPFTLP